MHKTLLTLPGGRMAVVRRGIFTPVVYHGRNALQASAGRSNLLTANFANGRLLAMNRPSAIAGVVAAALALSAGCSRGPTYSEALQTYTAERAESDRLEKELADLNARYSNYRNGIAERAAELNQIVLADKIERAALGKTKLEALRAQEALLAEEKERLKEMLDNPKPRELDETDISHRDAARSLEAKIAEQRRRTKIAQDAKDALKP